MFSSRAPRGAQRHRRPPDTSPHFGLRLPRDGKPPRYRVLIGRRWLVSSLAAVGALLAGSWRRPRHGLPTLLGGGLGLALVVVAAAVREAGTLTFERIVVPVVGLPPALAGLRIVQLSDLHLGWLFTERNLRRARAWVAEVQPDVLLLTGDFVSHDLDVPQLERALAGIAAPYGVYAVLGNHDYWVDMAELIDTLRAQGVDLLRNEIRALDIAGATLCIAGIDCAWESRHDIAATLGQLPPGATTIVMAHEPDVADDVAQYPVALQLSGHTHAGHIALPWLGPAFLPRHGMRYFHNLQQVGAMWLYVTRGLGGFPLRLGVPPEATLLTLVDRPERP